MTALLTILTAGVASAQLALLVSNISSKINKLVALAKMAITLPLGKLAKMSEPYLDKVKMLLRSNKKKELEEILNQRCIR